MSVLYWPGAGRSTEVFGVLFWIFLIGGIVIALIGFTSIWMPVDDQNSNDRRKK